MTAQEYAEQLAQAAELSADDKAAFLKVVSNTKIAKSLEEGVMLRSDYSRQSDKLKAESEKNIAYYQQLANWEAQRKADWDAAFAASNNGQQQQQAVNGEVLTKKDFEEYTKKAKADRDQMEANFIAVTKKVGRLASRHANRFHEELDTDALEKIVIEQKVDIDRAYDLMVGDRVKAQQEAAHKAEIDAKVQEGIRNFASQHQIPIDTTPRESGFGRPTFSGESKAVTGYTPNSGRLDNAQTASLRQAFVDEWNKAEAGTGAGT